MSTPTALQDPRALPCWAFPGEYFTSMQDEHDDVALRDLAEQLGLTMSAVHQQARAGKIPTFRRRNVVFVKAAVAQKIRKWHTGNRNRTWPVFTEAKEEQTE